MAEVETTSDSAEGDQGHAVASTRIPEETAMNDLAPQRMGYVGWVEFIKDGGSTTHIAYLYEDGSVYFPEGPQVVCEWDMRASEAAGRMWPLVRSDWGPTNPHCPSEWVKQ